MGNTTESSGLLALYWRFGLQAMLVQKGKNCLTGHSNGRLSGLERLDRGGRLALLSPQHHHSEERIETASLSALSARSGSEVKKSGERISVSWGNRWLLGGIGRPGWYSLLLDSRRRGGLATPGQYGVLSPKGTRRRFGSSAFSCACAWASSGAHTFSGHASPWGRG